MYKALRSMSSAPLVAAGLAHTHLQLSQPLHVRRKFLSIYLKLVLIILTCNQPLLSNHLLAILLLVPFGHLRVELFPSYTAVEIRTPLLSLSLSLSPRDKK